MIDKPEKWWAEAAPKKTMGAEFVYPADEMDTFIADLARRVLDSIHSSPRGFKLDLVNELTELAKEG